MEAAIEEAARSHAARFLNSQTHITGNDVPVNQRSILSHSTPAPRIATFQSDQPPVPLIFQDRGIRKPLSYVPARVAGGVPNLAERLIKWYQEVGGKVTELLRIECWSSRSFETKPFFVWNIVTLVFKEYKKSTSTSRSLGRCLASVASGTSST